MVKRSVARHVARFATHNAHVNKNGPPTIDRRRGAGRREAKNHPIVGNSENSEPTQRGLGLRRRFGTPSFGLLFSDSSGDSTHKSREGTLKGMVLILLTPIRDDYSQRADVGGDMAVRDSCAVVAFKRQCDLDFTNR